MVEIPQLDSLLGLITASMSGKFCIIIFYRILDKGDNRRNSEENENNLRKKKSRLLIIKLRQLQI